ncbi:GNAT family N-acetyltransferase [Roseomonas gilardii subsp. gilardii]|uniref:GNAT family N-acetyltransferase n=1 Tax=Roseomonas gilardii TaxID=257708 RepID=UPI001FF776A8|nr:GNAT family N-acetyltransferase [Roseomonas gilardii]UPG71101.1 GNAT family N-acetyltransferase [Roseomonas gilardii subsp. gilardii]
MSAAAPRFRDATAADLPAIVRLMADDGFGAAREAASPDGALPASYGQAFAAIAALPGWSVIVAEDAQGRLVGCLQFMLLPHLSHQGGMRAQVESVRIASTHRGQGLGTALMNHAIDRARQAGCVMVQLTTHASREQARRFYEQIGFFATHCGMKITLEAISPTS